MRRRTLPILLVVGALALTGCSDDADVADDAQTEPEPTATVTVTETETVTETPPPDDTATSPAGGSTSGDDVAALNFARCDGDRFSIGYPEDWNTNDPEGPAEACRVFHPGEVAVEPHGEDLHWAVSVYVDAVEYERARGSEPQGEVLEERELTIDGNDAVYREVISDGSAMMPEGETSATYIVDLDGEILVATTSTVGDTDYERDKEILERMITEELTFTTG